MTALGVPQVLCNLKKATLECQDFVNIKNLFIFPQPGNSKTTKFSARPRVHEKRRAKTQGI